MSYYIQLYRGNCVLIRPKNVNGNLFFLGGGGGGGPCKTIAWVMRSSGPVIIAAGTLRKNYSQWQYNIIVFTPVYRGANNMRRTYTCNYI